MDVSRILKPILLSVCIVIGLAGCVYGPHYSRPMHRSYSPYYYPFYYDYYFYPSVSVYFNYSSGYYYYPSGTRWISSKVLPPHIRLDSRERVTTRIEGDKPYLKNKQLIQKYPARRDYRPNPQLHSEEQQHNLYLYQQHQRKQKVFEEQWIKPKKKGNRPYWPY